MDIHDMVKQFADTYFAYQSSVPHFPENEVITMRVHLITEELEELEDAINARDIVSVADALGDLLYVVAGAALAFGLPQRAIVEEIHRSNMSKLGEDGKPVLRDDGKVLKGPNFTPPDIKSIISLAAGE